MKHRTGKGIFLSIIFAGCLKRKSLSLLRNGKFTVSLALPRWQQDDTFTSWFGEYILGLIRWERELEHSLETIFFPSFKPKHLPPDSRCFNGMQKCSWFSSNCSQKFSAPSTFKASTDRSHLGLKELSECSEFQSLFWSTFPASFPLLKLRGRPKRTDPGAQAAKFQVPRNDSLVILVLELSLVLKKAFHFLTVQSFSPKADKFGQGSQMTPILY